MKIPQSKFAADAGNRNGAAFTFTETLVTTALVLMVLAGVITGHLFGVHMFQITKAKLGASDEARKAISYMISEIRSAKIVRIGNGNLTSFTEIGMNTQQVGNAIQIYPTVATNSYIRYFWDTTDKKLKKTTNSSSSSLVVANFITNSSVFTSEDYKGTILTNNQNNRVIGLSLQFYQIQYPIVMIGPGNFYDFYMLRTKITRRALE